jgi:hypothetical protein
MVADMTVMFDNSRDEARAFTLVRAQRRRRVLFDCRDRAYRQSRGCGTSRIGTRQSDAMTYQTAANRRLNTRYRASLLSFRSKRTLSCAARNEAVRRGAIT